MRKSVASVVLERVEEVSEMLIKGCSRGDILQYASAKWNISSRQIDAYISKARMLIEKTVEKRVEFDYAKAIRRYERLYCIAIDEQDYRLALSVNKELTVLQGLNKTQIEHSGNVEFICNIPN
ncbi:hypothetical protein ACPDHL_07390 [Myroides sp. C15-4]|uniref:hypothetical protein n=1 Tax=Myroides sp. C15-4 TaxID=3400532 RepID=UPI003D2F76A6